ncbi:MAG: J domain-containing protein, partial [Hyphomonadaceae bacterium]
PLTSAFEYRPKYVDIRVKKPADEPARERSRLEPGERACDHVGCQRAGAHRAPKSRERTEEFWFFCTEHAAEYNRRWNYFAGMSDAEMDDFQKSAEYGHRPTWSFKASRTDRLSAAMRNAQAGRRTDAFGLFRGGEAQAVPKPRARRLTRLQLLSLEALALEENATAPEIRARYAELVKRYHPDVNGGDRASEAQLERVIRAYQTLKSAGLA